MALKVLNSDIAMIIGIWLKRGREVQSIDIEQAAAVSRLPVSDLTQIENGTFPLTPEQAFILSKTCSHQIQIKIIRVLMNSEIDDDLRLKLHLSEQLNTNDDGHSK